MANGYIAIDYHAVLRSVHRNLRLARKLFKRGEHEAAVETIQEALEDIEWTRDMFAATAARPRGCDRRR